jgi:hypothetical protein
MKRLYPSNQQGFTAIEIILAVVLVAAIGAAAFFAVKANNTSNPKTKQSNASSSSLVIQTDPGGLEVTGDPLCDSAKLKKKTPFTCIQDGSLETLVIAPALATINGKTYAFRTWDGRSADNADKRICKVIVDAGQSKTIKAGYDPVNAAAVASPKPTGPRTAPVTTCQSQDSDGDGFVTCTITTTYSLLQFSFQNLLGPDCGSVLYGPADGAAAEVRVECLGGLQKYYDGELTPIYNISCTSEAVCNTAEPLRTNIPDRYFADNLVGEFKLPGKMFIKVPVTGTFRFGAGAPHVLSRPAMFDRWETRYTPSPDPSLRRTELFIKARYKDAN